MPASSASPLANPPISRRRPRRQACDETLGRPGRHARRSLVDRGPPGGQDPVGERQDLGRGTVVRLEGHHPRRRIAVGERDQVLARRPGEGVDGLVLVTDHGQVVAPTEPRLEKRRLERIGVLVLVDREPAVAVADLGRDRRVGVDQPDRQLEHVLEVDPPGSILGRLVASEQAGHQVRRERRVAVRVDRPELVLGWPDPPGLGPFDLPREVANGKVAIAARQAPGQRGEDRHLGFEDGRWIRPVDARPEMSELAERGGMEGGRRDARLAERRESSPHLARRLVGERDDQHVAGPDDPARQRVGHPARDDAGLAAAGTGQDAQRSRGDRDGFALGWVEVGQEVAGVGHGHRPILAARAAPAVIRGTRRAPHGDATLDACRSGVDPSAFVRRRPTTPRSSPPSWPSRRSRPGGATSTSSASGPICWVATPTSTRSSSSTTAPSSATSRRPRRTSPSSGTPASTCSCGPT